MVTKGHRRLGKTIRILENSVELSAKESHAKDAERKYRENARKAAEDSPVQSLRNLQTRKQDEAEP